MTDEFRLVGWESSLLVEDFLFFFVIILLITLLRVFYVRSRANAYFPESAALIFLGLAVGCFVEFVPFTNEKRVKELLEVDPEIYLLVFIPIIIFDATYFLNQQAFFRNFLEIVVYAVIGTILNAALIAAMTFAVSPLFIHVYGTSQVMSYAALLSAIDPVAVIAVMEQQGVNQNLYNLIFGEATLNDGVAIVLFNLFKGLDDLISQGDDFWTIFGLGCAKFFVSVFGALAIGAAVTFLYSLVTRITYKNVNVEALVLLMCFMLCYILADALLFSGVIAVMTCALLMTRYCDYNCAAETLESFKHLVHMLSQMVESFLFFSMGNQIVFTVFDEKVKIDWAFTFMTPVFCFISRAVGVVVQTLFINIRRKKLNQRISFQEQIVLTWCGLRGGIAFSLAKIYAEALITTKYVQGQMFLFNVGVLIIFTIFFFGLTMRSMIRCLRITKSTRVSTAFMVLEKPLECVQSAVQAINGSSRGAGKVLFKIDAGLQKVCLKVPLEQQREMLEIAEFLNRQQVSDFRSGRVAYLNQQQRMQQQNQREFHEKRLAWSKAAGRRRAMSRGAVAAIDNDTEQMDQLVTALLDNPEVV